MMQSLKEALEVDEGDQRFQVANAFTFGKNRIYALVEVMNEEAPHAAVVLEIQLGAEVSYRPLLELDDFSLNYYAHRPDLQWVISHFGEVHVLENGKTTELAPARDDKELSGIAAVDAKSVAILGEEGLVYRVHDGAYSQIQTGSKERILAAHFVRPDHAYAVGNFGTFLKGGLQGFSPVEVPESAFGTGKPRSKHQVVSVHAKQDGAVMLGTANGPAYVYERGELIQLEDLPDEGDTTVQCVIEYRGVEYWGSTEYGLLTRNGRKLIPKFATGGAMNMHVTDDVLTLVAGSYVYVFDGREWVELQFNPDVTNLVERIPLDFEP